MLLALVGAGVYAAVECIQTPDDEVRGIPKLAWIFLILLFTLPMPLGPLAWFLGGRPRRNSASPGLGFRFGGGTQVPPDDDPEFLRGLGKR